MFASIDAYFSRCGHFDPEQLERMHEHLSYKKAARRSFLLRAGEVCRFEVYVISGCLKTFFIDEKGNEVILQFGTADWWVSDIGSLVNQSPSRLFIQVIEEVELLVLNRNQKEILLREIPAFERVFRLMLQRHLVAVQDRLINTMALPAEERYLEFIEKYPQFYRQVPQQDIAAYLGITPEFLSRLRRRLAHTS